MTAATTDQHDDRHDDTTAAQAGPSLGDLPEPVVEEPELVPGGVDAVEHVDPAPVVPDLHPALDPSAARRPAQTATGEDTSTEATDSPDGTTGVDPAEESPA